MSNRQRIVWYGLFFVAGLVCVALSALGVVEDVMGPCGITLAVISALKLLKAARYAQDPEFARRVDVSNADERLAFLAERSAQSAFQVSIVALCALSLALRPFGYGDVANVLGFVVTGELVAYWVSYLVASKWY